MVPAQLHLTDEELTSTIKVFEQVTTQMAGLGLTPEPAIVSAFNKLLTVRQSRINVATAAAKFLAERGAYVCPPAKAGAGFVKAQAAPRVLRPIEADELHMMLADVDLEPVEAPNDKVQSGLDAEPRRGTGFAGRSIPLAEEVCDAATDD